MLTSGITPEYVSFINMSNQKVQTSSKGNLIQIWSPYLEFESELQIWMIMTSKDTSVIKIFTQIRSVFAEIRVKLWEKMPCLAMLNISSKIPGSAFRCR